MTDMTWRVPPLAEIEEMVRQATEMANKQMETSPSWEYGPDEMGSPYVDAGAVEPWESPCHPDGVDWLGLGEGRPMWDGTEEQLNEALKRSSARPDTILPTVAIGVDWRRVPLDAFEIVLYPVTALTLRTGPDLVDYIWSGGKWETLGDDHTLYRMVIDAAVGRYA
jgi:hypothetical protein